MKAIHNNVSGEYSMLKTVVNKAKIQNESNSQHDGVDFELNGNCCQQSKDTK